MPGSNLTADTCVYHDSRCNTQPWARAAQPYCTASVDSALHSPRDSKMIVSFARWVIIINGGGGLVDADVSSLCRRTHSPSWLAWSGGWRPPGGYFAFIKWTGWTLAMALPWWQHRKYHHGITIYLLFSQKYGQISANNLYIPEADFRRMACKLQEVTFDINRSAAAGLPKYSSRNWNTVCLLFDRKSTN